MIFPEVASTERAPALAAVLSCLVTGHEHSGTTLLGEILRLHSRIDGRFECGVLLAETPADFPGLKPHATILKDNWGLSEDDMDYLSGAGSWAAYYQRLRERSDLADKEVLLYDKMPAYMYCLDEIMQKVSVPCLVIMRDPRAVWWSARKRHPLSAEELCRRYNRCGRAWQRAVSRWPERILTLRHESLCRHPEAEIGRIFSFLGLSPEVLSFCWSSEHVRRRYPEGPFRFRRDGISGEFCHEYRQHLSPAQQQFILEQTSDFARWHDHDNE